MAADTKPPEPDWKQKLTPEQYRVLRDKGTEAPFTGKLLHNEGAGEYRCAACGQVIFDASTKFDSGSGWPSFNDAKPGAVVLREDDSFGTLRTEVTCANCGSHLGHMFPDRHEPTGQYFCINSVALDFDPEKKK
jgi:peptide-methionine (R)-S-oxide reductase